MGHASSFTTAAGVRSGARPFPAAGKVGVATMGFGLLFDLVEHTPAFRTAGPAFAGFPLAEHATHAVVLFGMVLVLVAIVADGVRATRGRNRRPDTRSDSDAIR